MVQQPHKLIKGFVWGKRDGRVRLAWIQEQMAELAPQQGGFRMPPIYTALQLLSGKVVGQWAAGEDPQSLFFGDILLCPSRNQAMYVTSSHMVETPGFTTNRHHGRWARRHLRRHTPPLRHWRCVT